MADGLTVTKAARLLVDAQTGGPECHRVTATSSRAVDAKGLTMARALKSCTPDLAVQLMLKGAVVSSAISVPLS